MCGDDELIKLEEELKKKKSLLDEKEASLQETLEKLEEVEETLSEKEKDLEEKDEKIAEYLSHMQRLQADFENYKKHTEKQQAQTIAYANEGLILKILDVYQDFERALNTCETAEELREGLEIIYSKKFKIYLNKFNKIKIYYIKISKNNNKLKLI